MAEGAENRFYGALGRAGDAGVMPAKGLEAMRVGGCEERHLMSLGKVPCAAIEIEEALVEMADLDRVKAVDLLQQSVADRGAEVEKRMRRETKKRIPAPGAQLPQIVKRAQVCDLVRPDIQEYHIRALEPHLGRLDEHDPHRRGVGEHFRPIENLFVQGDGEGTETKLPRALKQLVGGVIEVILRIVESVDMQIDLDPLLVPGIPRFF